MIKLNCIKTGSEGNSFIVSDGETKIMLDCGLNKSTIKSWSKLNKKSITTLNGILITHSHKDHWNGLHNILEMNPTIKCGCSNETMQLMMEKEERLKINQFNIMQSGNPYKIKTFDILPFMTYHGNYIDNYFEESQGFLLRNKYKEKIVYITDTGKAPAMFGNAEIYLIEANHVAKDLWKKVEDMQASGEMLTHEDRLLSDSGHLSAEDCGKYLKECVGEKTKLILLMHLNRSDKNRIRNVVLENMERNDIEVVALDSYKILENKEFKVGYEEVNPF